MKRHKLYYAYRSISGKVIKTYDWYVGNRITAVDKVKQDFRISITPLVWIGSPKTLVN